MRWLPKIALDYLKTKTPKRTNIKPKSREPTLLDAICSPSPAVYSIPPAQMVSVPSQPSPGTGDPTPASVSVRGMRNGGAASWADLSGGSGGDPCRRRCLLPGLGGGARPGRWLLSPAGRWRRQAGSAERRGPRRESRRGGEGAAAGGPERGGLRAPLAAEGGSGFWEVGFGNLLHKLLLAMTPGGRRRRRQGGIGSVNEWAAAAAPELHGCWAETRQPRNRCLLRPPVFFLRLAPLGAPQTCSTSSSSSSSCCSSSTFSSSSTTTTPRRSKEAGKRRYARPGISGLSPGTRFPPPPSSPRESRGRGSALPSWAKRQREGGLEALRGGGGARGAVGRRPVRGGAPAVGRQDGRVGAAAVAAGLSLQH